MSKSNRKNNYVGKLKRKILEFSIGRKGIIANVELDFDGKKITSRNNNLFLIRSAISGKGQLGR